MSIDTKIYYEKYDSLFLDPMNPRLGRYWGKRERTQEELLDRMRDWKLEEIALSYISSGGFWVQEALIVVEEEYLGKKSLLVVEGNRRLAAIHYLKQTLDDTIDKKIKKKWLDLINDSTVPKDIFNKVPYMIADSRSDIATFLGFRHVSGITQWDAEEKAGFIAQLIDDNDLTFADVAKQIGSRSDAVQRHYIAFKILQQIERDVEFVDKELTSRRFTVLYMSLKTVGAQNYLGIGSYFEKTGKIDEDLIAVDYKDALVNFSRWVFGDGENEPLVINTNLVSLFGKTMEMPDSLDYLKSKPNPSFEVAIRLSGGLQEELERYLDEASHNIQLALMSIHRMKDNSDLNTAFQSLKSDFDQLSSIMESE